MTLWLTGGWMKRRLMLFSVLCSKRVFQLCSQQKVPVRKEQLQRFLPGWFPPCVLLAVWGHNIVLKDLCGVRGVPAGPQSRLVVVNSEMDLKWGFKHARPDKEFQLWTDSRLMCWLCSSNSTQISGQKDQQRQRDIWVRTLSWQEGYWFAVNSVYSRLIKGWGLQ